MWVAFAFGSALFAGFTAILAKIGIRNVDANLATALRTVVILFFSWLMVWITGAYKDFHQIQAESLVFLVLSGLATGASWLFYFQALAHGSVNIVTPIDKSSVLLTMLFAFLFFQEAVTTVKIVGMLFIALGTYFMVYRQIAEIRTSGGGNLRCIVYACLSAVFAAATAILGKLGTQHIDANLSTAIRTIVVLLLAWGIVFSSGQHRKIKQIDRKSLRFILLSGFTTGASWLCFYRALRDGLASVVVPIDKLSIVLSVLFAAIWLKERLTKQIVAGLTLITIGTLVLLVD